MARKKSKSEEDSDKKIDEPKQKREIRFDPSDGVTWHDFVGLILLFFIFIWKIIRLVLAPFFWVYGENVRMFRFIRATGKERTMNEEEQKFVESIPFIFMITGIIGGVLVGIFASLALSENLEQFAENIQLDFVGKFFDGLGWLIGKLIAAVIWIAKGVGSSVGWAVNAVVNAFKVDPFLAFIGLAFIGIIAILIWVTFVEKGAFEKTFGVVIRFLSWLIGSPERFRFRVDNYYRKFNHKLTKLLIGETTLITRTQVYFKKSVFYTVIAAGYSFLVGIWVGTSRGSDFDQEWQVVLFVAFVLFVAGILSGTLFFALMARFLDLMNRKKYLAPEYIKDGDIDESKIEKSVTDAHTKREKAENEYQTKLAKMSEKPWKKRKTADKSSSKKKTTKSESAKTETSKSEPSNETESAA